MKLTETAIRSAKKRAVEEGKRLELADSDLPGLRLRITPTGAMAWILGCRDPHGKARRFALGRYPDRGIAEAREAARSTRTAVRAGADPIAEARQRRAASRDAAGGIGTLGALVKAYEEQRGKSLRSWPECRRRIESVFSKHLRTATSALTRAGLQEAADRWPSAQSAAAAVRYLRPVLKWAAPRRLAPDELCLITPPAKVARRKRTISADELAAILPAIQAADRPHADAMLLMLLTLTRREEVARARWRDVDMKAATWTIPLTKNGEPHAVPLSRQALALIAKRQPERPKPSSLVFATGAGSALGNWDRETKLLMVASETSAWTRHDLRRTGATMLGEMGEMPDIIEAALNHVAIRSPIAATYNRSRYRPQVAAALQRLADKLDEIQTARAKRREEET